MKELVIISGKGGTGKTSVTASLAVLADNPIIADCDVDAADLHLILTPEVKRKEDFYSGREAVIKAEKCIACGACREHCRFKAVRFKQAEPPVYSVDPIACEGCGVCVRFCPVQAIDFPDRLCGEWMISKTRSGSMVHARLGVAADNSGKLVATVREEARRLAAMENSSLIIIDGPPGIGCPVIASVTGADLALVVTEPTLSGEHDAERVLALIKYFKIPALICINKWDLNPEITQRIETQAKAAGVQPIGRIRYDSAVTQAQMQGLAVVETEAASAGDILNVWKHLAQNLAL